MTISKAVLVSIIVVASSACTTTREFSDTGFSPPAGKYKVIVMQPDISVGVLTLGGVVEPNEDWTRQAREHVLEALVSEREARGATAVVASTLDQAGGDTLALRDMVSLHKAVGESIFVHKYYGLKLPTKKDRFDWTLGDTAVAYGEETGFDYALFLHAETSFSSEARKGAQVAGWLSCAVGVCVGISGGQQIAFASLVDLKSGQVTWFNTLKSSIGDIRTAEGARDMVTRLFEPIDSSGT